ncbi:MAG: CBS domain-containing protein [Prosthecobacter sp.]
MPRTPKKKPVAVASLKELAVEKAGALHPQDSVASAGTRMREHAASTWPVVEDRKLVGVVDKENPDWEIGGRGHDPQASHVGQIMNRQVVFCYEDEDCAHARSLMEDHDLSYLPVVDREMRIVGIFSLEEIQQKARRPGRKAGAATTTTES